MRRRLCAALMGWGCLLVFGCVGAGAQQRLTHSFFSTLSYDTYVGSMYDWYHGYALGLRIAVPLVKLPTLNSLFSVTGEPADDLTLLPGVKAGAIKAGNDPLPTHVVYFAPELSLHYTLLRLTHLAFAAGPAFELIYTNNYFQYKAVSSLGIDLGAMWLLSRNLQLGLEHRWIVHEGNPSIMNAALFPRKPFSQIGVVVRFSLPGKSEAEGYDLAQAEYEQKLEAADAGAAARRASDRAVIDSLGAKVGALESALLLAQKKPVHESRTDTPAVDPFNTRVMIGDPEYAFTKDPFKAGNLVNDGYLKDVLIDILDDEYVWQLRTSRSRKSDAEKIRAWFVLYNNTLSRRIVLAEDDSIPLFTLRCLGKASVPGIQ